MRRLASLLAAVAAVVASTGLASAQPSFTHGVASGEVTADRAVIWSRADRAATMLVRLAPTAGGETREASATNTAASDWTAQVVFDGLSPATPYTYRVVWRAAGQSSAEESGSFRTAPAASDRAAVSFVVGGDLGGQTYCRRVDGGYAIFSHMAALEPDFFIANGDLIYADNACPERGPEPGWKNVPGDFPAVNDPAVDWLNTAQVREVYLAHWRYNRADPAFQEFLRRTPMLIQWDDHEVINDFGAEWEAWTADLERRGFPNLVAAGRESLFLFHPFVRDEDEPDRVYRSIRYGRELELFLLDARSYRSLNDLADRPEAGKTMLGDDQLEWLKRGLSSSTATWKVVSSDVPFSVPTGSRAGIYGRDAFAAGTADDYSARTGFERELMDLVRHLDRTNVKNLVVVATDVHFAMNVRYELDADGDGDLLRFHELVDGPLNAGRTPVPAGLDPSLRPVVLYAEGDIFNFGHVVIEPQGETSRLVATVRGVDGEVRPGSRLEIVAER